MRGIRYTDGSEECLEPSAIFLMVQGDFDQLAVRFDQESHEVASEGVSSIPGRNWARGFQKAAVYPSQWNNHGMDAGWQII